MRKIREGDEINPFFWVLVRPRETVRIVLESDPRAHVTPIALMGGILITLHQAALGNLGDDLSLPAILGLAAVLGPLLGLVGISLLGHLLTITGAAFGGRGDATGVQAALAWAGMILIWLCPLWILKLFLYGGEAFASAASMPSRALPFGLLALEALQWIGLGWAATVLMLTLAEVHAISLPKAMVSAVVVPLLAGLGALLLAGVVV